MKLAEPTGGNKAHAITSFDDAECEVLLREFLSPALFEAGLICRADDRGDPVVQLSPPLVAGEDEFDQIEAILRRCLAAASDQLAGTAATSHADEEQAGEQWS